MPGRSTLALAMSLGLYCCVQLCSQGTDSFGIQVVDGRTGRGIPLVELTTTANQQFLTDSGGWVAFNEPGLMDQEVFFHVRSPGYRHAKDGFGFTGKKFQIRPGGKGKISLERLNLAQRLYRVTGYGLYRDTVLLGETPPINQPLLNGLVAGSDSVQNALYRGTLHWFWGDTHFPRYPLGNFQVPGAISALPAQGGLNPTIGIDLDYFLSPDGSAAETARMGDSGFTWLSGLASFKDNTGRERMFGHFVRGVPDEKTLWRIIDRGAMEFDGDQNRFRHVATWDSEGVFPDGAQAFIHKDYLYFADPFPRWRVSVDPEKVADQTSYESFTPLPTGARGNPPELLLSAGQDLQFAWKKNTRTLPYRQCHRLIEQGKLTWETYPWEMVEVDSGKHLLPHRGSVAWNAYRQRWVMIFGIVDDLGAIYYSESRQLLGPWLPARKVADHGDYSFYNPVHHPMLDQEGGRLLFFEGTYSQSFSKSPVKTPLYDYNQIMYMLDLDDPRLNLPPRQD